MQKLMRDGGLSVSPAMRRAAFALAFAAPMVAAPLPLAAQDNSATEQMPGNGTGDGASDPCQVAPRAEGSEGDQTLTDRLDECDGVLQPVRPRTGGDFVEQPPAKGRTPVIKPKTLPGDPQ